MKHIAVVGMGGIGNPSVFSVAQCLREANHPVILVKDFKEPTMVIHDYKLPLLPNMFTPPITRRERRALERKNKKLH